MKNPVVILMPLLKKKGLLSSVTRQTASLKRSQRRRKLSRQRMTLLMRNIQLRTPPQRVKALCNSAMPLTVCLRRLPRHRKRSRWHMTLLTRNIQLRTPLQHVKGLSSSAMPLTARLRRWPQRRKRLKRLWIMRTDASRQTVRSMGIHYPGISPCGRQM